MLPPPGPEKKDDAVMKIPDVRGAWFMLGMMWVGVLVACCIVEYGAAARSDKVLGDIAHECDVAANVSKIARDMHEASSLSIICIYQPDDIVLLRSKTMFDRIDDDLRALVLSDPSRYSELAFAVETVKEYLDVSKRRGSGDSIATVIATSTSHLSIVNMQASKIIEGHCNLGSVGSTMTNARTIPLVTIVVGLLVFCGMLMSLRNP